MAPPREVVPKAGSVLVPGGAAVPKENEAGGGGNVVFPNPPPEPPKLKVDANIAAAPVPVVAVALPDDAGGAFVVPVAILGIVDEKVEVVDDPGTEKPNELLLGALFNVDAGVSH